MRLRGALVAGLSVVLVAAVAPHADAASSRPLKCAQPDGRVTAIAISGNTAYLGGRFTHVQDKSGASRPRGHLAAVDTATCELLPWQADTNGEVASLAVAGGTVFVGGSFSSVNGASRLNLAGVTAGNGAVTSFDPRPNREVLALSSSGSTLYAGGEFTQMGGASRTRLAAFQVSGGTLSGSWAPSSPDRVLALAVDGSRVYVGGGFKSLNGLTAYRNLAAVNASNGQVDSGFRPGANFPVEDLDVDARGIYGAGGGGGGRLGIWNRNGALQQPYYVTDGDVQAVAVRGGSVYAGGHFDNYCRGSLTGNPPRCTNPVARKKIFEVGLSGGQLTGWAPMLNSALGVFAMAFDSSGKLWVGGDFTQVDFKPVKHLAVFPS